jgi:ribosomal-protein-alanine N-acetyltransferase
MPHLELVRADHAAALLAFELANRDYFAASIPDRGDEYFTDFAARHAHLLQSQAAGTDYFHLLLTDTGEILGRFNLIMVEDDSAELGYRVARDAAGRGLATAAVAELRKLAATEYGLRTLRAKVTADNPASQKVLERNGFLLTGELVLNGKPALWYLCELG